jgi:hypothetical protein
VSIWPRRERPEAQNAAAAPADRDDDFLAALNETVKRRIDEETAALRAEIERLRQTGAEGYTMPDGTRFASAAEAADRLLARLRECESERAGYADLAEHHLEVRNLQTELNRKLEGERNAAAVENTSLREQIAALRPELEALEERARRSSELATSLAAERDQLAERMRAAQSNGSDGAAEIERLQGELKRAKAELAAATAPGAGSDQGEELTRLRAELAAARQSAVGGEGAEIASLQAELAETQQRLAEARIEADAERAELYRERGELAGRLDAATFDDALARIDSLIDTERERDQLRARVAHWEENNVLERWQAAEAERDELRARLRETESSEPADETPPAPEAPKSGLWERLSRPLGAAAAPQTPEQEIPEQSEPVLEPKTQEQEIPEQSEPAAESAERVVETEERESSETPEQSEPLGGPQTQEQAPRPETPEQETPEQSEPAAGTETPEQGVAEDPAASSPERVPIALGPVSERAKDLCPHCEGAGRLSLGDEQGDGGEISCPACGGSGRYLS